MATPRPGAFDPGSIWPRARGPSFWGGPSHERTWVIDRSHFLEWSLLDAILNSCHLWPVNGHAERIVIRMPREEMPDRS